MLRRELVVHNQSHLRGVTGTAAVQTHADLPGCPWNASGHFGEAGIGQRRFATCSPHQRLAIAGNSPSGRGFCRGLVGAASVGMYDSKAYTEKTDGSES